MTTEKTKEEQLQDIGASAMASIREMVAALDCDRERLEELREERDNFDCDDADERAKQTSEANLAEMWAADNPEEADELKQLEADCTIDGREVDAGEARQRIEEDALSVQVRGGWHNVGDDDDASEYEILLSTGGPATRIIGELNEHHEPTSARLQAQDWFTPWTDYSGSSADDEILLRYASCFYFGD